MLNLLDTDTQPHHIHIIGRIKGIKLTTPVLKGKGFYTSQDLPSLS
jgi:hypothetical protein